MRFRKSIVITAGMAVVLATGVGVASASPSSSSGGSAQSGYNAIPSKVSGNVISLGFEATATTEFGDEVGLSGSARGLQSMSVVLSSWGCETGHWGDPPAPPCVTTPGATFDVPMTFTVYADNAGVPGAVLAQQTQTFAVAYRPSASPLCTSGKWYNSKDKTCYNGFPQIVQMNFTGVTLPSQVIWSVSYNTTHYGSAPVGESAACFTSSGGCGYDSLNVGAESAPKAPFAGVDLNEDLAFVNGVMESGWTGYRPMGALVTK